jgi:thiosulfate/3-mercaptopyruvate sulfurtransferase
LTLLISTQKLDELIQKKDKKLRIIDTRSFGEYVLGHIPGSINTELMQFHWSDTTKNGIKQFNKQNIKLFSNFGIKKILFLFFMKTVLGLQLQEESGFHYIFHIRKSPC